MLPTSNADPEQLEILAAVLDEHCNEFDIDKTDATVREAIARRLMLLFMSGIKTGASVGILPPSEVTGSTDRNALELLVRLFRGRRLLTTRGN